MGSSLSTSDKYGPNVGSFITYDEIYKKVAPGDLIEIQRPYCFKHWVLYEITKDGNVWCYHVTSEKKLSKIIGYLRYEPLLDILEREEEVEEKVEEEVEVDVNGKKTKKKVIKTVKKVVNRLDLCRVNNQEKKATKEGVTARPLDDVFRELRAMKDKEVEYQFNINNCEYYCTLWKYGKGWSVQVDFMETRCAGVPHGVGWSLLIIGAGTKCAWVFCSGGAMLLLVMAYYGIKHWKKPIEWIKAFLKQLNGNQLILQLTPA
ncbi:unnamed protein product [Oppiella nova]|uniref:LRAT domain-containing protein n=1 Tax=Oppiella nova TaxID=334625 RepID=A0A7R9L9F5_9ACAR|nr:unnamed protein product [Oppiella nova]CAG2160829.1 unnamed protein product [Oppiella nova]